MLKMVVDTHTHSVASGHAYSTVMENCREASKKGLKLIGLTDHGPAMPGGPHIFYINNQRILPDFIEGIEILRGVEANIVDYDGRIDLEERSLKNLDLVIASLHDVCIAPGSVRDNTRAIINAMKNKYVDIIAHPGNPAFPINIDEILLAAREYNILIEINNSSLGVSRPGSCENCRKIAEGAAQGGNIIVLGSDAHSCFAVGEFEKANLLISEAGVDYNNVMNTDENKLKSYLKAKGKLRDRK